MFSVVIIDLIGFGVVMPVLPFYAAEFGANATALGGILAVHAAAQFVFAPIWGRLSDRIGRRPVLILTVSGTAFALLMLGLADSLAGVFLARVLGGAFAANVSVASAYLADVTDDEERTRWMGMLGASFGIGFVLGPALGGGLAPLGYTVPILTAAGLAALNAVHALISLPEPPRHTRETESFSRRAVLRDPRVRLLCLANLVFALAVTQLETLFPFLARDRLGYGVSEVAFILVGMAIVMGGIQGGGMKALAARYPERSLVITGTLLLALGFAVLPHTPGLALMLLALAVVAVGRAISQPSLMSLASLSADPARQGAVMGAFHSAASLARVVGPAAAGLLYDQLQAAPFWLAAGLLLVVAGLARGFPERQESRAAAAAGSAIP
ncbi:MAG: MFS transporter [Myxococcota bacterium]